MNIETVNELIASLESAGELSIREQKFLKLAKEFRICSASLDAAIKTGNMLADQNAQLAAENEGYLHMICDTFADETPATDRIVAGIKADGVEEWVSSRGGRWNGTTEEALKFAKQLREGKSEEVKS